MAVVFKTNEEIFQQQLVNCVNAIAALRYQLNDSTESPLEECVKQSINASIVHLTNRLDALVTDSERWKLPKLNNQDIASAKFEQEFKMAEYALFAQEVNKQVALGNIIYTPTNVPTVEAEPIPPTQPNRKPRRKKK